MRNHTHHVLKMTDGKVQGEDGAAAIMGINFNTLRNRMTKPGITFGRKIKF